VSKSWPLTPTLPLADFDYILLLPAHAQELQTSAPDPAVVRRYGYTVQSLFPRGLTPTTPDAFKSLSCAYEFGQIDVQGRRPRLRV
jgi:hypothetical protein